MDSVPHIHDMINGPPTTEDDPDGLMSVAYMEALFAAWKVGCWFWQDDDQPVLYRDGQWVS